MNACIILPFLRLRKSLHSTMFSASTLSSARAKCSATWKSGNALTMSSARTKSSASHLFALLRGGLCPGGADDVVTRQDKVLHPHRSNKVQALYYVRAVRIRVKPPLQSKQQHPSASILLHRLRRCRWT